MTDMARVARNADKVTGVWADSVQELISYRYLGCRSDLLDRHHATGHMRLRSDMRTSGGGVLTAPLAIAMMDAAGNNVDRYYHLALTHVDVHLFEPMTDVREITVVSEVAREARTAVFTECRFVDAGDPHRVVGFGSADWLVIAPTPPGFVYTDPGAGVPDSPSLPPLWEAYDAQRRPEGGFVIPGLSRRIGDNTLHHGPILVSMEAAAQDAVAVATGDRPANLRGASTRIVKAGRQGPFVATAEVLRQAGDTVDCRAVLRDDGIDATVAVALLRFSH